MNSGIIPFVLCVTIGLLVMSWGILIFSKTHFKKVFDHKFWKVAFIIVIGFSSVVDIFISGRYLIDIIGYANEAAAGRAVRFYLFNAGALPLVLVFFIAYCSNFILRLKKKNQNTETKIEDH
jgi:hypothetical protein